MGRSRPCDACRRRKSRCIQDSRGQCQYCAKNGLDCSRCVPPKSEPLKMPDVKPLETPPQPPPDLGKQVIPPGYDCAAFLGPSCSEDPVLLRYYKRDPNGVTRFVNQGIHMVDNHPNQPTCFVLYQKRDDELNPLKTRVDERYHAVSNIVAPYKDQLLALYFRFIDWTYPAVDKASFYEGYYFKQEKLSRGLLCGMLALSCIYWKYNAGLCVKPMPPNLPQQLWQLCHQYIDEDIARGPTLSTLQALLIYCQKRLPRDNTAEQVSGSIQRGRLVSLAFSLGLHLDPSEWSIGDHEKQIRRRLWALVYCVDKWTAATSGQPSLLQDARKIEPVFTSSFDQEQLFVQTVRLTQILADLLRDLYDNQSRYSNDWAPSSQSVLSAVDKYLAMLRQWRESLPEGIAQMSARTKSNYCRNGMIHLSALTIETLLLRILLHPRNMSSPQFNTYRAQGRNLVERIIQFTGEITHSHLHAFWLSWCSVGFSQVAHFVLYYHAQSGEKERKENKPLMRKWLWALRVLSNAWQEGTGLATLRMDEVFYMGETDVHVPAPAPEESREYLGLEEDTNFVNDDIIPIGEQNQIFSMHELDESAEPGMEVLSEDLVTSSLHDIFSRYMAEDLV